MPQFQQAWKALHNKNTTAFNERYGVTPPPSPSSSPSAMKKVPSQFELASLALREGSPIPFNDKYSVSSPRRRRNTRRLRKNHKQRKASRKQRRTK
jgi:hypothetical protein